MDLTAIKNRMKATWEDGNYARFATYMQPGAIEILKNWQIQAVWNFFRRHILIRLVQ